MILSLPVSQAFSMVALENMLVGALSGDGAYSKLILLFAFGILPFVIGWLPAGIGDMGRLIRVPMWWLGTLGLSGVSLDFLGIPVTYGWCPGLIAIAVLNPLYKRREEKRAWSKAQSYYAMMSVAGGGKNFWAFAKDAIFCPKHIEMTDVMVRQNRRAIQNMRNHLLGRSDQTLRASKELDEFENLMLIYHRYMSVEEHADVSDGHNRDKVKIFRALNDRLKRIDVLARDQRTVDIES